MNSAAWTAGQALPDQAFSREDPFKMSVYPRYQRISIKPTAAPVIPAVAASMPKDLPLQRTHQSLLC
jgi:hypothetical protein